MRPLLYISGPYSAGDGRTTVGNIAIARAHAEVAWRRGWAAICPHLNTARFEETCPSLCHDDWLDGESDDPSPDSTRMSMRCSCCLAGCRARGRCGSTSEPGHEGWRSSTRSPPRSASPRPGIGPDRSGREGTIYQRWTIDVDPDGRDV